MNIAFGFILVLGVLILVHEWGHFIVARLFNVRVDVFSIGFGPRLFGFKWGATDWRISAIPLGGYVRMAGQDITEVDSSDQAPTGAPDELMSKPRWQRALISVAGPAINLIFPLVLLTGYFMIKGDPYPKYNDQPLVILGLPADSPLAKLGAAAGDRIVSLNGIPNPTWGTVESEFSKGLQDRNFQVAFNHQGTDQAVAVSTSGVKDPEHLFGYPPNTPLVGYLDKSKPAAASGIRRDDIIESMNGEHLNNWQAMVTAIQKNGGHPAQVTVRRKSESFTYTLTPVLDKNEKGEPAWVIGIRPGQEWSFHKVGLSQSFASASNFTVRGSMEVLIVLKRLLTGEMSAKQLQSVIGIASEAGHAVQEGTFAVITLMAALSLNLGILNLMPIPILDGGNILLLALEGIRRRDFSLTFKERFIQVGLVFLLVLFAYVMYNDVVRLLPTHS
jgi:regulator of sigma E protease